MPYDMIRENLENMFKERLKKLKERKRRKLPSKFYVKVTKFNFTQILQI